MSEERKQDLAWIMAQVSLGLCLSSKESLRYTALWRFDEKSIFLVMAIGILFAVAFFVILKSSRRHPVELYRKRAFVLVLAALQTAGMVVHVLASSGVVFSDFVIALSILGHELSLLLFLIASQYLYSFKNRNLLSGLVSGVALAGSIQILLVFLDGAVARPMVASFCFVAALLLCISLSFTASAKACADHPAEADKDHHAHQKMADSTKLPRFRKSMLMIFLASLMLMGAYSQWQIQQDGGATSMLIQICSGLGLVSAAAFFSFISKRLKVSAAFFLCQTIILPITIGSLYLGAIFEGPIVSISLLLFDLSYGMILFTIWLSPLVYTENRVIYTITAGFLAHKMGWVFGIGITRSFPWSDFAWIGVVVVVLAFLLLFILSVISLVNNYRATDNAFPSEHVYELEEACEIIGEQYALTKREREVLVLLAKGRTAAYLARDLYLSESTARTHISHIYRKLSINSQQTLIDMVENVRKDETQMGGTAQECQEP